MRSTCTSFYAFGSILAALLALTSCGMERYHSLTLLEATPLITNSLAGNTSPVHDPSIIRQNGVYYLFSSDPVHPIPSQYLPIRCSPDAGTWKPCGQVFTAIPAWITSAIPGIATLWAPDISYFNGVYHLYYAASTPGSQVSFIGLETNTTLDPSKPNYKWIDHGSVLASHPGDDFNAIDPNILVDTQHVWLTYGSYWTGIKQREIDPSTGQLLASNPTRYNLAVRPGTPDDAIEGASLLQHGGYYYLFLSVDHCCENTTAQDNYKQIVGRSTSPNGPFLDATGADLTDGGGSILLEGNAAWIAPGGGTAYIDTASGTSMLVFHSLDMSNSATPSLWIKSITWQNNWPYLN